VEAKITQIQITRNWLRQINDNIQVEEPYREYLTVTRRKKSLKGKTTQKGKFVGAKNKEGNIRFSSLREENCFYSNLS
jgi:hypothetical protein